MTYNNYDDTTVPIPRELFEARQRELAEIKCIKKPTLSPRPTLNNEEQQQYGNTDKKKTEETCGDSVKHDPFNQLLRNTIDEEIKSQDTKAMVVSIDNIPSIQLGEASSTTRGSCIVENPHSDKRFLEQQETQINNYEAIMNIPVNPHLHFTTEERNRVEHLLELEKFNIISFNELEYDVAAKVRLLFIIIHFTPLTMNILLNIFKSLMLECLQVIQEMFDKAFSSSTMDYELIFWGYTVAIKKITWFAQVCKLCLLLNFKIFFQRQFTSFLFARLKTRKVYFFRILTRCSTSSQRDSSKAKPAICMNNSTTSVCLTRNI